MPTHVTIPIPESVREAMGVATDVVDAGKEFQRAWQRLVDLARKAKP